MSVRIIVDSTVDLAPERREQVTVVPLNICFGEDVYVDGVTIDAITFYQKLVEGEVLPTTSQPTPAAFEDAYRNLVDEGHEVLVITIASRLSGTYQSATIAAEEFPGKVFVLDSRSAAIGSGILAAQALKLAQAGMGAWAILNELMELRKKVALYFVVDTLDYLHKGGRLNGAVAVVGGLLNIKPILHVDQTGEIKMLSTARGAKKAFAALNELSRKDGGPDYDKPIMLAYTGASDENLQTYLDTGGKLWAPETEQTMIGPTIGVHAGPGAVAVAFFKK